MGTPAASPSHLRPKPLLSFWEIWNMSVGFLGIQFGFALQNTSQSRIFQTLGAKVEDIALLWIAAPVTGLIVQPIVGYFSDRTWNRLGRRRPYFFTGAILASLALIAMPNSPVLWVAAGLLWIQDASINISMEPFRAFVGDNLPSTQRTTGFAMQSFFIGTGAVVGSLLPWILTNVFGAANTAPEGQIPPSVRVSYYLTAVFFFAAVLWTVLRSHEYPPEEMASFAENQAREHFAVTRRTTEEFIANGRREVRIGLGLILVGVAATLWLAHVEAYQVIILSAGLGAVGVLLVISGLLQQHDYHENAFVTILNDFLDMPRTMKQLAWAQFFSWFALFAMWIYTTPAVTSHVYHATGTTSAEYNEGANWVGICFAVYNGIAAVVAFLIPPLARWASPKAAHIMCLVCGAIGLFSIYFVPVPHYLLGSMVGVGIAWASILAMPYAILTGSLPPSKLGYYMGVFNFFIVIPQIVAAAVLGFFVKHLFHDEAIYALLVGGVSLLLAAALMLRVDDRDDSKAAA